jgi:hypothetical protein
VSLTQLLVDPYFRTRRGFCILIEKDWIRFGHQFAARYGNSAGDHEKSPIMIQWLDTVFRIMGQFLRAFEFNSEMLCDIADALYSCEFGTFLSNTEQDFVKMILLALTCSLKTSEFLLIWKVISNNMGSLIEELTESFLRPDIIFWNDLENKVIFA